MDASGKRKERRGGASCSVALLVGAPGSGKSTFANEVLRRSTQAEASGRKWARVCQDTIGKKGNRGTRKQCVQALEAAVKDGTSVLVDRCHASAAQRSDFLKAAADAKAKGLVRDVLAIRLDVPLAVLKERVLRRVRLRLPVVWSVTVPMSV